MGQAKRGFRLAPHSLIPPAGARPRAAGAALTGARSGDVWEEVQSKQTRMGVPSSTAANLSSHRQWLPGSSGFPPAGSVRLCSLGDDLCLDAISRPDASLLWPKLRAGYLLDALERLDSRASSVERISSFVDEVSAAQATRGPSAGLGEDYPPRGGRVIGSGLELDDETISSAFHEHRGGLAGVGRIASRADAVDMRQAENRLPRELKGWIRTAPFRFARTMPQNRHWYVTARDERERGFEHEFRAFVDHVRAQGSSRFFKGYPYKTITLDDHDYWSHLGSGLRSNRQPQAVPGGRLGRRDRLEAGRRLALTTEPGSVRCCVPC